MRSLKSNINRFRKHVLQSLTQNVGKIDVTHAQKLSRESVHNILIVRPNHRLGNQILMTPMVQEIERTFPHAKIDLFAGKVAPILFVNYPQVDQIIRIPRKPFKELVNYAKAWTKLRSKKYDFVFNVDKTSSSGRLATKFARGKIKLFGEPMESITLKYPDYSHIAKFPVYYFREIMTALGYENLHTEMPNLNLKLSANELKKGKELLEALIDDKNKPTITLYTFATGAKCYSETWWLDFYHQLTSRFSGYNFLEILPVENISMISFKAPTLYSKDVREMAAVMANTEVYIGADCGVMHLASAAGIPTMGFFSVTSPENYAPYNLGSIGMITTNLENDTIFAQLDSILQKKG